MRAEQSLGRYDTTHAAADLRAPEPRVDVVVEVDERDAERRGVALVLVLAHVVLLLGMDVRVVKQHLRRWVRVVGITVLIVGHIGTEYAKNGTDNNGLFIASGRSG